MLASPTPKIISHLQHRAHRVAAVIAISLLAFAFFSTLAEFTLTGDALAQENRCVSGEGDPPCPVVTLESISPSGSLKEGTRLTVTVRIGTPVPATSTDDMGAPTVIKGGIYVFDSCEALEPGEDPKSNEASEDEVCNGEVVDELIAWAFWAGSGPTTTMSHTVSFDRKDTRNRVIRVRLHPGWEDHNVDETAELRGCLKSGCAC